MIDMERLRETEGIDSHESTERQLPLWPSPSDTKASEELLVPREWIEEHSLRPDVAIHGDPVEIRKMINQGIKPKEIILLKLGR